MGRLWTSQQLKRTAHRLSLCHPLGYMEVDEMKARVQELWNQNSRYTAQRVVQSLGAERRVGDVRAFRLAD
jgi:hypothetical protein